MSDATQPDVGQQLRGFDALASNDPLKKRLLRLEYVCRHCHRAFLQVVTTVPFLVIRTRSDEHKPTPEGFHFELDGLSGVERGRAMFRQSAAAGLQSNQQRMGAWAATRFDPDSAPRENRFWSSACRCQAWQIADADVTADLHRAGRTTRRIAWPRIEP